MKGESMKIRARHNGYYWEMVRSSKGGVKLLGNVCCVDPENGRSLLQEEYAYLYAAAKEMQETLRRVSRILEKDSPILPAVRRVLSLSELGFVRDENLDDLYPKYLEYRKTIDNQPEGVGTLTFEEWIDSLN